MRNPNWRARKPEVFEPALANRPSGPRQGDSKVALVKQGVRGALRAKNLRLLLDAAPAPEDLALLAEVPRERLQNMAGGALCSDETAYHLEQQLELPSGWLDRVNSAVPARYLELLAHPPVQDEEDEVPGAAAGPAEPATPSMPAMPANTANHPANARRAALQAVVGSGAPAPGKDAQPASEPEAVQPERPSRQAGRPAESAATAPPKKRTEKPETKGETKAAKKSEKQAAKKSEKKSEKKAEKSIDKRAERRAETKPEQQPGQHSSQQRQPGQPARPAPPQAPVAPVAPVAAPAVPESLSPKNEEAAMTSPTELHRANLNVLLSGKGAKSALARLLGLSPASVTGMLNGAKPLDPPLLETMSRVTKLGEGWFDSVRTPGDISAETQALLSPLVRGSVAPAPAAAAPAAPARPSAAGAKGPGAAGTAAAPGHGAKDEAAAPGKPQTWPAAGSKVARLRGMDQDVAAGGATPGGARAAAPHETAPQHKTPEAQRGDVPPEVHAVLADKALPPIAEALIRTLAQKASTGALSEDQAFELLGNVRALP